MSIVTIESNRYTISEPLYQWDLNQVLTIYGLSLPAIPEIHFTNDAMDRAIVRQATMNDAGVISAEVPNSLLQKPYKIRAYVCMYEGDAFKSLYLITIPVEARSKPNDYTIAVDDEEVYSFNALENKLENVLSVSLERYDEANTKYEQAETRYIQASETYDRAAETLGDMSLIKTEIQTSQAKAEAAQIAAETARRKAESAQNNAEDAENNIQTIVDELPNNQILIENVANHVPMIKVAEQPEFANNYAECVDTSKVYVLPNGHLCMYISEKVTTEDTIIPDFINLYDPSKGAYIKDGYRYSKSNAGFVEQSGTCALVIPMQGKITRNEEYTLRIQGATMAGVTNGENYYFNDTDDFSVTTKMVGGTWGGTDNTTKTEADGLITIVQTPSGNYTDSWNYLICHVGSGFDESKLIVTVDQEIKYTIIEGETKIESQWTDTGIEYNQPPDYVDRVISVERKTVQLETDVNILENKIGSSSVGNSGRMDVFGFAAYPPSPQIPGDGSETADFNVDNVTTPEIYAYMDVLANRYRTYMVKQNLGKDSSGQYDYYRYVLSKTYWRAWYKENYPRMFAWINGSTVIYSESVSPRVGDTMYSTPYIGAAYKTVTAVNSTTLGAASTRTVNGLVFTRYAEGDVEPTIVYTIPIRITNSYKGRTYTDAFDPSHSVTEFSHEYIVDSTGTKFYRYPFEDRKLDGSRPLSVFILANEHGNDGDSMIPSVVVMRMVKDICQNTENLFLKWLKENTILTIIPVGNPYGTYRNANGVNINRNYDTPGWIGSNTDPQGGTLAGGQFGAYAGSEIETQYIMNTIQLAKADVAMSCHGFSYVASDHGSGEYNGDVPYQGGGFDAERLWKVEEALFSGYNLSFSPSTHTVPDQTPETYADSYLNAGKSPSYIEYSGAVGGLIEMIDFEIGTADLYTPMAMEAAYAELLLVLQNWCEEALLKNNS